MKTEEAKKGLMVVHRDSPIRKTRMHFYSVSSVKRLTEKLKKKIKELEELEKKNKL